MHTMAAQQQACIASCWDLGCLLRCVEEGWHLGTKQPKDIEKRPCQHNRLVAVACTWMYQGLTSAPLGMLCEEIRDVLRYGAWPILILHMTKHVSDALTKP